MRIEFQLATSSLLAAIRNLLESRKTCYSGEISVPIWAGSKISVGTRTYFLDHIDLAAGATLQSVPSTVPVQGVDGTHLITGSAVRLDQPLTLHLVTESDLAAADASPVSSPPALTMSDIHLLFDLSIQMQFGTPHLVFKPVTSFFLPEEGEMVNAALAAFNLNSIGFELPDVQKMLGGGGGGAKFSNAGMAIDQSGDALALRFEIGLNPTSVATWTDFFQGAFDNLLGGQQWGLFVDRDLIVPGLVQGIAAGVQPQGDFSPDGAPTGSWAGSGHGVQVVQPAVLHNQGLLKNDDVHLTVTFDVDYSVPMENTLRTVMTVGGTADTGDIVDVLIHDALEGALGGLLLGPGGVLAGLLGGFSAGIVGLASMSSPGGPTPPGFVKTGDNTYEEKHTVFNKNELLGVLDVEAVVSNPNGLQWVGQVRSPLALTPAVLEAIPQDFRWAVTGSCSQGYRVEDLGGVHLENLGTAPLSVCPPRLVDDSGNLYSLKLEVSSDPNFVYAATIEARYGATVPTYACKILVLTNGGARLITLAPPTGISESARQKLEDGRIVQIGNCEKLVNRKFFLDPGDLRVNWGSDPTRVFDGLDFWQVYVSGLGQGEQVILRNYEGQQAAAATATSRGDARLSALLEPSSTSREITLQRQQTPEPAAAASQGAMVEEDQHIEIQQVQLERTATVPLLEPCRQLTTGWYRGGPAAFAVGAFGLRVYDLSQPAYPALLESFSEPGIAGGMPWGTGLLTWGTFGLVLVTPSMSEPQVILDAQTVYDAAYYGQRIYAVTEEGLVVLNAGLEEIGRLPLIGGRHVTVRGSTLGIGDGETLHVVDVASPHAPRAVASHVLAGTIVDIRPPGSVTLGRLAVARGGSSGEILVHALEDSQVIEVASFAHTPWFAQGGFVGEAYVRLAADRMSVEAYKVMWRGMV